MGHIYEKANFQNIVLASATTNKIASIALFDGSQLQRAFSAAYEISTSGITGLAIAESILGVGSKEAKRIVGAQILYLSGDIYASWTGLLTTGLSNDVGTIPTATTGMTLLAGSYYSDPIDLGRIE